MSVLADRLRRLAELLPDGGSVTLTRRDLEALIGATMEDVDSERLADLTVEELADELGRKASTVRGWAPRIDGAYKLGREWRFPRTAVRRWLDAQSEAEEAADGEPVDLGSWRSHVR